MTNLKLVGKLDFSYNRLVTYGHQTTFMRFHDLAYTLRAYRPSKSPGKIVLQPCYLIADFERTDGAELTAFVSDITTVITAKNLEDKFDNKIGFPARALKTDERVGFDALLSGLIFDEDDATTVNFKFYCDGELVGEQDVEYRVQ